MPIIESKAPVTVMQLEPMAYPKPTVCTFNIHTEKCLEVNTALNHLKRVCLCVRKYYRHCSVTHLIILS